MGIIQTAETDTYQAAWALDAYGDFSPGERYLPLFLDMARPPVTRPYVGLGGFSRATRVLDAGTGSGKGALALAAAGFDVIACDLTADGLTEEAKALPFVSACLWSDLRAVVKPPVEYAYCCDVLEHIPPEFTMLVCQRVIEVAKKGAFFSISLVPDQFGVWVGKPLHQTVQPFQWWRDRFRELGALVECRDLRSTGVYFVRAA